MSKLKIIGWIVCAALCGWLGWHSFHYFFTTAAPVVQLSGIDQGGHYAGDVSCVVHGKHPYKVKKLSVFLDNKPLISNFSIGSSTFDHPFTIQTRAMPNGQHKLQLKAYDGTVRKNETTQEYDITIDNTPLQAALVKGEGEKVFQGRTLHLQFQTNKPLKEAKVHTLSREYDCFPESPKSLIYESFIPTECEDQPNEYMVVVDAVDNVGNKIALESKMQIVPFPFKKMALNVSEQKVKEEKALGLSAQLLEEKIVEATANSPKEKLWRGSFSVPTEIAWIASPFGAIRATPERGMYMHKAIDIANTPKSVIWCPQKGVVVDKERYEYSGNTVIVDHGYGVLSMFFHLDQFANGLHVGQKINKGNPVGTLGKTGYANGYHLHWEMRVNNVAIDPMQSTKPGF